MRGHHQRVHGLSLHRRRARVSMKAWGPLEVRSLAFSVEERGAAARRHRRLSPVGSDTPGGPTSPGRRASGYRRGLFWRPRRILRQLSRADSMAANRSDFLQPVARGDVGFKFGVPTGIRTPVTAVKGRCPRPLDDGDFCCNDAGLVEVTGIEPVTSCMPCKRSPS